MEAWQTELTRGRPEAAWDRFLDRYRRLIFAAIRHYVRDHDDLMDVFTRVCEALREDDLRRLRSWAAGAAGGDGRRARFSTWLVVVVHNLTVDWLRARDGRPRAPAGTAGLTPLQRAIYDDVFVQGLLPAEAYERIRARHAPDLRFGPFLKELQAVHRVMGEATSALRLPVASPADRSMGTERSVTEGPDPAAAGEVRRIAAAAMEGLAPEDRAAVQLYVMEGLDAAEVARLLGLRSAKAVYNRVYRALALIRDRLEAAGIRRDSLF